jgi:ammonium transporter Rh
MILFGLCTSLSIEEESSGKFAVMYQMWTGIEIMMFFGFGYLMTFLKRYGSSFPPSRSPNLSFIGMGAVGFTMLITVLAMQWGILVDGFFGKWYNNEWGFIEIDMIKLIESLFLVAAILISYGAVIGKVSPLQLIIMTFFEVIFYSINKSVLVWGLVDLVDGKRVSPLYLTHTTDDLL